MAKVKIQGNASGTGIFTVTAPNSSTDRTITLPDNTGALITNSDNFPAANLTGTVATAQIADDAVTTDKLANSINTDIAAKLPLSGGTMTGTIGVTTVDFGDWTITESSGVLYFATGGTNKMKLDASGNLTCVGDVTANGSM